MSTRCSVCGALVPAATQFVGTAIGALVGAAIGVSAKSTPGKVIGALAPLAAGLVVDQLAAPVCGNCRRAT